MYVTIKHSKKIPMQKLNTLGLGWGSPPPHKRGAIPL